VNAPQVNSIYCAHERGARSGPAGGSNKRTRTQPATGIQHSNLRKKMENNNYVVYITCCSRAPGTRQVMVLSVISQANVVEAGKCAGSAGRQEQSKGDGSRSQPLQGGV
jgi:hypothetical protein